MTPEQMRSFAKQIPALLIQEIKRGTKITDETWALEYLGLYCDDSVLVVPFLLERMYNAHSSVVVEGGLVGLVCNDNHIKYLNLNAEELKKLLNFIQNHQSSVVRSMIEELETALNA